MRGFRPVLALLVAIWLASCSAAEQRAPAEEALGAALKVGSLGTKRAQNKDCWIRCGAGTVCNVGSGRCEPGECHARCDVAWHCVHDARHGDYCMRDSDGTGTPGSLHVSPAPTASSLTDAGTPDAALVESADAGAEGWGEALEWTNPLTTPCEPKPPEPPKPSSGNLSNPHPEIARLRARFRACYTKLAARNPDAEGSARLALHVDASGRIRTIRALGRGLARPTLECLCNAAADTCFPPPEGGSRVVNVPVTFAKLGKLSP